MASSNRAARTRDAIIDAAADVFDRYGYQAGGLALIIKQAGVTTGAFYFHFTSKEELARVIIDQQFQMLTSPQEEPASAQEEPASPLQSLVDLTYQVAQLLVDNVRVRASIRLVIEHASFTAPLPDPYLAWIDVVGGLLEQAQRAGQVRRDMPAGDLARLIVGAFTGIQLTSEVLTGRKDLTERLHDLWLMLRLAAVTPRYRDVTSWLPTPLATPSPGTSAGEVVGGHAAPPAVTGLAADAG